jgi:hypothetical protein
MQDDRCACVCGPRCGQQCGLRREVIDHDVDESVVADEIRHFAERVAAASDGITRARNSRHHLHFLTCGKYASRHHGIGRCQLHGLRKTIREPLCSEGGTRLRGIPYEHEERCCVRRSFGQCGREFDVHAHRGIRARGV